MLPSPLALFHFLTMNTKSEKANTMKRSIGFVCVKMAFYMYSGEREREDAVVCQCYARDIRDAVDACQC